ncbi:DUF262 domain-containing protein [Phormidesmis priestleyi]
MDLQQEIDSKRQEIKSDSYSMSIGEWLSLYENEEIDIHPEFQRFFRWSGEQKSKLIESLLLGIPIPPIFVSQREDGVWDVVDGLQRLSTIYQFAGILRDEDKKACKPLVLESTKYLPALLGKKWDDHSDEKNSLTQTQRLLIKRSKIGVAILQKESDPKAKYELFQRLNTGGSIATDQEVRNCLLIMSNREMYRWMRDLSRNESFQSCLSLSDKNLEEQYDMELLLRFLIFRSMDDSILKSIPNPDISVFLTNKMIDVSEKGNFDYETEKEAFQVTFRILSEQLGGNSFKKYDHQKDKFVGGFIVSMFEVVALGMGYHYEKLNAQVNVLDTVKKIWKDTRFTSSIGGGISTRKRVQSILPLGREMFHV